MRRKINRMLSFGLALIMMFSIAGCGSNAQPQAEIDPDTPVSEVQFPLKETAELSFITSAPATSTQDPNERIIFKDLRNRRMCILNGRVLYRISFLIKKSCISTIWQSAGWFV